MNIKDYGFTPDMVTENEKGIPARVIAVHKERYALICEYGETYGRLKTKELFFATTFCIKLQKVFVGRCTYIL